MWNSIWLSWISYIMLFSLNSELLDSRNSFCSVSRESSESLSESCSFYSMNLLYNSTTYCWSIDSCFSKSRICCSLTESCPFNSSISSEKLQILFAYSEVFCFSILRFSWQSSRSSFNCSIVSECWGFRVSISSLTGLRSNSLSSLVSSWTYGYWSSN